MDVYSLDPLDDPRWAGLVERHPRASVFHSPAWLRALQRSYGFRPLALTTSAPSDALNDALLLAEVRSRLTGRRLVSLPFSDHCDPLVSDAEHLRALCAAALRKRVEGGWSYLELRPAGMNIGVDGDFAAAQSFMWHCLDLRRDPGTLLRSFHKDSIQRKIRRAERERLTYEAGRSDVLLHKLRGLLDLTRRRHQAPLQPVAWFRNLIEAFGEGLCIRIVSTPDGRPAAGILTLLHRDRMVYKYGGSDPALNALGGTPWVFWKTIEEAKARGAAELDLGRSDTDNAGLIAFKDHWGATRHPLTYWRAPRTSAASRDGMALRLGRRVLAALPAPLRRAAGTLLYPHIG